MRRDIIASVTAVVSWWCLVASYGLWYHVTLCYLISTSSRSVGCSVVSYPLLLSHVISSRVINWLCCVVFISFHRCGVVRCGASSPRCVVWCGLVLSCDQHDTAPYHTLHCTVLSQRIGEVGDGAIPWSRLISYRLCCVILSRLISYRLCCVILSRLISYRLCCVILSRLIVMKCDAVPCLLFLSSLWCHVVSSHFLRSAVSSRIT